MFVGYIAPCTAAQDIVAAGEGHACRRVSLINLLDKHFPRATGTIPLVPVTLRRRTANEAISFQPTSRGDDLAIGVSV
jgi:hypothetical protein